MDYFRLSPDGTQVAFTRKQGGPTNRRIRRHLPGLVTEGDVLEEVRAIAHNAIVGYLESLPKDGQPIPEDIKLRLDPVKEEIEVALPEAA